MCILYVDRYKNVSLQCLKMNSLRMKNTPRSHNCKVYNYLDMKEISYNLKRKNVVGMYHSENDMSLKVSTTLSKN